MNLKNIFILLFCIASSVLAMEEVENRQEQLKNEIATYGDKYCEIAFYNPNLDDNMRQIKDDLANDIRTMSMFLFEKSKKETSLPEGTLRHLQKIQVVDGIKNDIFINQDNIGPIISYLATGLVNVEEFRCEDMPFSCDKNNKFSRKPDRFTFVCEFLAIKLARRKIYTHYFDSIEQQAKIDFQHFIDDIFSKNSFTKKAFVLSVLENLLYNGFMFKKDELDISNYSISGYNQIFPIFLEKLDDKDKKKLMPIIKTELDFAKNQHGVNQDQLDKVKAIFKNAGWDLSQVIEAKKVPKIQPKKQGRPLWQKLGLIGLGVGALSALAYYLLIYKRSSSAK